MATASVVRLPNTVTKCHAMIGSLQEAVGEGSAERIAELEAELDETKEALAASEADVAALEAKVEKLEADPDVVNAIDVFLQDPKYFEIACERIDFAARQPDMFGEFDAASQGDMLSEAAE